MPTLENDNAPARSSDRVERSTDNINSAHASNEVYGKTGDRSTLDSFRQTRNNSGADSLPGMTLTSGDGQVIAGSGNQNSAGQKNIDSNKSDSNKDGANGPNKTQLEQGVVSLDSSNPARTGSSDCSGFLVNKDGTSDVPKGDSRLVATAAHCVSDRQNDQYKLNDNLFGKDGKDQLSKQDLAKRGDDLVKKQDPTKPGLIYASDKDKASNELDYLKKNYDGIKSVSQEKDPAAKGITSEGLKEFRDRQTSTTVDTAVGKFKAEPVAIDKGNDLAIMKIKGLTQEQQEKLGPNQKFATEELQMGDKTYSMGQGKIREGHIDGLEKFEKLGDKNESIVIDRGLDHGMSGGPTRNENGDVIGVNHAGTSRIGAVTPITDMQDLLNRHVAR